MSGISVIGWSMIPENAATVDRIKLEILGNKASNRDQTLLVLP